MKHDFPLSLLWEHPERAVATFSAHARELTGWRGVQTPLVRDYTIHDFYYDMEFLVSVCPSRKFFAVSNSEAERFLHKLLYTPVFAQSKSVIDGGLFCIEFLYKRVMGVDGSFPLFLIHESNLIGSRDSPESARLSLGMFQRNALFMFREVETALE